MLKCRVIPILTFNGFALVKTKGFGSNARMVGNAVQAAKVYNSRNVDELVFLDIYASDKNRKMNLQMARLIINECFMPVSIGGGIKTIQDIEDLLAIGADKVVLKRKIIEDPEFINEASYRKFSFKILFPHNPMIWNLSRNKIQDEGKTGSWG